MVRALLAGGEHPVWSRARGALAPELILAEIANALVAYVRAGDMTPAQAASQLRDVLDLELRLEPLANLVGPALETAFRSGLSAYDACYLALAEQTSAVLVTADRRLAAASPSAELVA